jgi:hypothetical protein
MPRQREPQICCSSRCARPIDPSEPAVEVRCFARTHGMGTRRTSKSESMFLCPQCATRTVILEKPPSKTEPFHLAIFKILLDLVGEKPDVVEAVYNQVKERRNELLYPPALPEPEILPPQKRLKEAS